MAKILRFPDNLQSGLDTPIDIEKNVELLREASERLVESTKESLQALLRDLNMQLRLLEVLISSIPDKKTQVHLLYIQTMLLGQVESTSKIVKLL